MVKDVERFGCLELSHELPFAVVIVQNKCANRTCLRKEVASRPICNWHTVRAMGEIREVSLRRFEEGKVEANILTPDFGKSVLPNMLYLG